MDSVTVIVATYGDYTWKQLAYERAIESARRQAPVIYSHAETLAAARNAGIDRVKTSHFMVLDADDEIAPGYVETMLAASGDVRVPAVSYVQPNGRAAAAYVPKVPGHACPSCTNKCLGDGNYIVVGAVVSAEFKDARYDGWDFYEDWAYWLSLDMAGAKFETVPGAVYRAHVDRGSRNRARTQEEKQEMHKKIYDAFFCEG